MWAGLGGALGACGGSETENPPGPVVEHSGTTVASTIAITKDDSTLWVVNQDADSVSVIDVKGRSLLAEIPLGPAPAVDPATKRFDPAIAPRSLAIVDEKKVYVAGQMSNRVYVIDAEKRAVLKSIEVPAAPSSIAAAPDGSAVYVVSHEAAQVTRIDPKSDTVVKSLGVTEHPWAVSVSADGGSLFVTHLLLEPGVSVIDTKGLTLRNKVAIADQPPGDDKRIANGVARGVYAAVPAPVSGEIWVPHLLLAIQTPQPDLNFESTVFPTISTLDPDGSVEARRLLFRPAALPAAEGSFFDVVSGPRAVAFTPSGKLALVADAQSEDVMIFNADTGFEIGLVRPLPSALLEGIVVDHAGKHAYVEGRNTHDVTVLSLDETSTTKPAVVDGKPIERLTFDPMPADLRLGQRLFYTANSSAFPITQNFWVACSSCHIEGGSDAVTWLFSAGPRDTPSNAGGPINTGFLLRQGLRNDLTQYDETDRIEQGGSYDAKNPAHLADLEALAAFVNYAIPFPPNPYLAKDGKLTEAQAAGKVTFDKACANCHSGPYLTDSGDGNPTLDFSQKVLLHDVGTCVTTGDHRDQPQYDVQGNMHTACDFDTPTLRGIFATAPYFHDGSARTLRDVVDRLSFSSSLSDGEKDDLVAYLQTL
ncbi:Surface antigen [Minicystis rosea]|nr:Surface antigen [Minicystis rosea]